MRSRRRAYSGGPRAELRVPLLNDMGTHMKTTVEISDALLERAKRLATRESTTLRELIEAGLRTVLRERREQADFTLADRRVDGRGLQPEFQDASWERIREAAYEGRGA